MAAPNWSALRVALNDRAAIYAEHFPASLAELKPATAGLFTHEQAQDPLLTFAGACPVLGQDPAEPTTRFVYLTLGNTVCRFRSLELAPGAIVVDDVLAL